MSTPIAPRRPQLSETARYQILLVLLCGLVFLTNVGGTHLWDEDEAHFGSTVSEMMQRDDLVVPYFNGALSLHKPAFMYWVMMLGIRLFGNCEFAMRIGSTLFGTGTVLLTYHAARMLFTPRVGFWSAAALATCLQFMVIARAAVSDPELVFFCTLSSVLFIAARYRRSPDAFPVSAARGDSGLSWSEWAMCYAAMGLAVLVKGPVGVVLPTAALGLYLLFEHADVVMREREQAHLADHWLRRWLNWLGAALAPATIVRTIWAMRPFTALLVVTAIAAPWYVWAGIRTHGEWPRGFLLEHNVGRFSRSFEGHAGTAVYYPVAAAVGMFPWSMFLYQTLRGLREKLAGDGPQRRACLFLVANIVVWLGAFSIASTKLPHYIVPAYPAMATLCGAFVAGWVSREVESSRGWLRVSWGTLVLVGVAVVAGTAVALRRFLPGEMHLMLIGVVPFVGGLVGLWAYETDRRGLAGGAVVATGAAFCLSILAWAAPQVSVHQNSPHVAAWVRDHATTDAPRLKSYGFFLDSLVYYARQPVERLRDPATAARYFQEHTSDAFLVTTRDDLESLRPVLPEDIVVLESMPRFLRRGDVVLLGRAARMTSQGQSRAAAGPSTRRHE